MPDLDLLDLADVPLADLLSGDGTGGGNALEAILRRLADPDELLTVSAFSSAL